MPKIFIDTNILVYASDRAYPDRMKKSRVIIRRLGEDKKGVISTQVMQEFYVAAVKKLGMDPILAKSILHSFENFELVVVDSFLIKEAIDCSVLNKISFWDSLIIVSAENSNCGVIWTEDLNSGQIIRGVRIENPLE